MPEAQKLDLPLRRVALFSSGVGHFEHRGEAVGDVLVSLPFRADDVSDALKSLLVLDPESTMPTVTYPAEDTLQATLSSLKPDLTRNPGLGKLLNAVRGAEVEVTTGSGPLAGRVLGVERRAGGDAGPAAFVSLWAAGAVQVVPVADILSYRLLADDLAADVERALDLLLGAATSRLRHLDVHLPADGAREITLTYVTGAPVWKAAYRLDLTDSPAFLQGWAVVDNTSDTDWRDVELSLFVGRPSSFRQPLYEPLHVTRRELPLAVAEAAAVRVHGAAYDTAERLAGPADQGPEAVQVRGMASRDVRLLGALPAAPGALPPARGGARLARPALATAAARPAGEQFALTFPHPVTLDRHRSAMLPLVQGDVAARKLSIFQGQSVGDGDEANPALGVELVNDLGSPLPAGPITVFDSGLYAGDALWDFVPADGKRLLSYGDDLAVRGSKTTRLDEAVVTATAALGVLRMGTEHRSRTEYRFANEAAKARLLLVEHPRVADAELVEPARPLEVTADLWRFEVDLPAGQTTRFAVETRTVTHEAVRLVDEDETRLTFLVRRGLPQRAKAALERAAEFRRGQATAEAAL
ncbi:MAG: DUF4139 domain-containing protein, partial [Propionibacteriaceae bacterium]|nr:DUF4139 domain-containing protein [Propionibacteriaceae bacterium]